MDKTEKYICGEVFYALNKKGFKVKKKNIKICDDSIDVCFSNKFLSDYVFSFSVISRDEDDYSDRVCVKLRLNTDNLTKLVCLISDDLLPRFYIDIIDGTVVHNTLNYLIYFMRSLKKYYKQYFYLCTHSTLIIPERHECNYYYNAHHEKREK